MWKRLSVFGVLAYILFFYHGGSSHTIQADTLDVSFDAFVYLPLVQKPEKSALRVNAPYFEGDIPFSETAIFWFGQVNSTNNYTDVRVGYNQEELYVRIAAFDRRLWYDKEPSLSDLNAWDAVSLYLHLGPVLGGVPSTSSYLFIGQLNWWEQSTDWHASYRGDGSGWVPTSIPFTTASGWRGNALNDDIDDRGWKMTFRIPFSGLGLLTPPPQEAKWGLALTLHDRDDAVGTPIPVQTWPVGIDPNRPETWGQLHFGLPTYTPPASNPGGMVIIRHDLNDANVVDAQVGGDTTCGQPYSPDFFNGWGDANYAGYEQINIQNQADVADWPCFSKYYVTLPLGAVPPGKVIISAKLKMFLFGNSGQGWEPPPQPSLIQVLTVGEDWDENTITWNNAPLALENVGGTWVDPVEAFPGWLGIPYEWDVSGAVAEAYQTGEPLRLALYSADGAIHSGKYFISSDTGEWNADGRPTLSVVWGEP